METLFLYLCFLVGAAIATTPWVENFSKRVDEKVLERLRSKH